MTIHPVWFIFVLPLFLLMVSLWVFFPPKVMSDPDWKWCEENGGRWISSPYNQHCQFLE